MARAAPSERMACAVVVSFLASSVAVSRPIRFALGGQNLGVVGDAIEQCRGQLLVAEYLRPFPKVQIGRDLPSIIHLK